MKRFFLCCTMLLLSHLPTNPTSDLISTAISEVERNQFHLPVDGLIEETFTLQRGQTLSTILKDQGISQNHIHMASMKASAYINLRHIRRGDPIHAYTDTSTGKTSFIVYQPNVENYLIFDLRDSVLVHQGAFPVSTVLRSGSGTIKSSLYQAVQDAGFSPEIAHELSQIFAWQVSFFNLQKDDDFSILFEDKVVNNQSVGVNFKGARMKHKEQQYYAFAFSHDNAIEFFDETGHALRRPFLKAPIEFTRISSRYSLRRFHPVNKRYQAHLGTDFVAPTGTPIVATADGTIVSASYNRSNGNYVKIRHNDTYTTGYLHMSGIASGIRAGVHVTQNQVIGYVGSTGLATGPHVCYRFWENGKQVDALKVKMPPSEPLPNTIMPEFMEVVNTVRPELDLEDHSSSLVP